MVRRVSVGGVASPVEQLLRVTEINYQPHGPNPIPGLGEPDDGSPTATERFEYIELANTGGQTIDLSGVRFTAGIDFTFPAGITLGAGQRLLVVKDRAVFESRYGTGLNIVGQFQGTLDDAGEGILLDTANSRAIQSFAYGTGGQWPGRAAGGGSSLEVVDTAAKYDSPDNWRASSQFGGSPGRAAASVTDRVLVSEVLTHTDSPQGDMIELHNAGGLPVDIGNWYLSNSGEDYFQFRVPSGTVLDGLAYQAFSQSQFEFDLDGARGDDLWVIAADAAGRPLRFVNHVQFGPSAVAVSMGPWPAQNGPWIMLAQPTFGQANAQPYVGPVVISELYYAPVDPDHQGKLKPDDVEFIELHNASDGPLDIGAWQLTGDVQFTFPSGTTIGGQQTLLVVPFDPSDVVRASILQFTLGTDPSTSLVGPFGPALNDQGGSLQLVRPDTSPADDPAHIPLIAVDRVIYSSSLPWSDQVAGSGQSLARVQPTAYGQLPTSWSATPISPGRADFFVRLAGDANQDGQFDAADILQLLNSQKYMTGQPASWADGDWDGDGLFNQRRPRRRASGGQRLATTAKRRATGSHRIAHFGLPPHRSGGRAAAATLNRPSDQLGQTPGSRQLAESFVDLRRKSFDTGSLCVKTSTRRRLNCGICAVLGHRSDSPAHGAKIFDKKRAN